MDGNLFSAPISGLSNTNQVYQQVVRADRTASKEEGIFRQSYFSAAIWDGRVGEEETASVVLLRQVACEREEIGFLHMTMRRFSNVIGIDDAPFAREQGGGAVPIVGAVYASLRLDGVLIGAIEKDGTDVTEKLIELVASSRFYQHIQLVLLQGVTFGGFNVVDVPALVDSLKVPALVVCRKSPDMEAMRKALLSRILEGESKWQLIEKLGPMELLAGIYVQRVGMSLEEATQVVERFAVNGQLPEPLRTAHLIAGALVYGESRGSP